MFSKDKYGTNKYKPKGKLVRKDDMEKKKKRIVPDSQEYSSDEDFIKCSTQPKNKLIKPAKRICINRTNEELAKPSTQTALVLPPKREPSIFAPKKPTTSSYSNSSNKDKYSYSSSGQRSKIDSMTKSQVSRSTSRSQNEDHDDDSSDQDPFSKYDRGCAETSEFIQTTTQVDRSKDKLFLPKSSRQNKSKDNSDDDSDFKSDTQRSKLFLPSKKKKDDTTDDNSNDDDSVKLEESKRDKIMKKLEKTHRKEKTTVFTCSFCLSGFDKITNAIQKELDLMAEKDRIYKQKYKEEHKNSSFKKPDELIKREVSSKEKELFCRLHERELVTKPKGEEKGYLFDIDFKALRDRIKKMEMELDDVVYKRISSDYRKVVLEDYDNLGSNKARTPMMMMNRMDSLLPGYYGPRGAAVMLDVLSDLYLRSGKLSKQLSAPQMPMEYVHQVLIPETAYRLIRQDIVRKQLREHPGVPLVNANSKAKKIMRESRHFGEAMHPLLDDKEEEDNISTFIETRKENSRDAIILD